MHHDTIRVINRCRSPSRWMPTEAHGVAVVGPEHDTSKLKVSFSVFSPAADYWILAVGPLTAEFDLYPWAVVGTPDRRYAWILSRTTHMDEQDLRRAKRCLQDQGFDVGKLVHVEHTVAGGTEESLLNAHSFNQ